MQFVLEIVARYAAGLRVAVLKPFGNWTICAWQIFGVGTVLMLSACTTETPPPPANYMEMRKQYPISYTYNVLYLFSDSAEIRARLRAPRMLERPDPGTENRTFLEMDQGVNMEFFGGGSSTPSSVLRANEARFYESRNFGHATGNVVVTNSKGDRLETESLKWQKSTRKLTTDGFVKITTEEEIIIGDSLEADQDFNRYKIFKIRGTFTLKD